MTTKHTLVGDGAPFNYVDGTPINSDKSTRGVGVAKCACGWWSDQRASRADRKQAHAEHKVLDQLIARTGDLLVQPLPQTPTDDVPVDNPEETSVTAATAEAPAKPGKVQPNVAVTYEGPKHLFGFLTGKGLATEFVQALGGTEATPDASTMTVTVYADKKSTANTVAKALGLAMTEAVAAFQAERKANPTRFKRTAKETPEAYAARKTAEKDFLTDAMAKAAEAGSVL